MSIKWIRNEDDLVSFFTVLNEEKIVCFDTEFIPEKSYQPKLELIQLGVNGDAYLLDYALNDVLGQNLLGELVKNEQITLIFHAFQADMQILFNKTGKVPKNVLDSQIAANFCGFKNPGYGFLVRELLGLELDKSKQRTNWSKRPFSNEEIEYAANDVIFLQELYPLLQARLEKNGNLGKYLEEIEHRANAQNFMPVNDDEVWKKISSGISEPVELQRLKFMADWREKRAKKKDIPSAALIKNQDLKLMAKLGKNWDEDRKLGRYKGLAFGITPSIERAENTPENTWPEPPSRIEKINPSISLILRALREKISFDSGISAEIICSTQTLEEFRQNDVPESLAEGWRFDLFTDTAIKLLNGEKNITIVGGEVVVRDSNKS